MSTYVGRRLNLYGLHDNVTAGVVLIKVLRPDHAGGRVGRGYYQGLGSVRAHGLYRSTKHYVRNVLACAGGSARAGTRPDRTGGTRPDRHADRGARGLSRSLPTKIVVRARSFPLPGRQRRTTVVDRTVADPMIGRVLDGRYRVGPRIARGGMATVYEATDLRLDRICALKVMHPGLGDDDEFAGPLRARGARRGPALAPATSSPSSTRATTTARCSWPWSTSPATPCAT